MIRFATKEDIPQILAFIKHLADYEKLSHEVVATEQMLLDTLFGEKIYAEALIAETSQQQVAGFALFYNTYSTFLAKPGIHLEDLYVLPEFRRHGFGKALLKKVAGICVERDYGRLEWFVLDWNTPAINFYQSQGAVMRGEWIPNLVTGQALVNLAS